MADNGGFNFGDIECGRSYPLVLDAGGTVAAELAQIPGYATNGVGIARASFDAAPFGTTWTLLSSTLAGAVLPVGSSFRKLTTATFAALGRITRIVKPDVDVIAYNNADDTFITSLTVVGGADVVTIGGTLRNGNGVLAPFAPIKAWCGPIAGQIPIATIGANGTLQYTSEGLVSSGCEAVVIADAAGIFAFTFNFNAGGADPALPVVLTYRGLTIARTAAVT